tara:strand:+ start:754 stop:1068 length:315 start_codon:yes stop_codon:yes gene_type:complete
MVSNEAISHRHGGHHEAQKFNTTICPRRSDIVNVPPLNNARSKSCAIGISLADLIVTGVGVDGTGVAVGNMVAVAVGSGSGVADGTGAGVGTATSGVATDVGTS